MRGYTWLGLSNDSTCTHQLFSHSAAYETLQLHSLKQPQRDSRSYSLPQWAQGHWESVSVKGGRLVYKSDEEMLTYSLHTLSSPLPNRYLVRLESSCGQSAYACLAMEMRTNNIMELMLGKQGKSSHQQLCQVENFTSKQWITLGRDKEPASCPLVGDFSGALPDAEGLCARSITSCGRSDRMSYQVYNCQNNTEVFENRSYHCYGAFEEGGLVYTVVKRLDLPHKECFVGVNLDKGRSRITEAGTSCGRTKEPRTSGMLLSYTSDKCIEWQWEENTREESYVESNEGNQTDQNHTHAVELQLQTTTAPPVILKGLYVEQIKDKKKHVEYETIIVKKNMKINKTDELSDTSDGAHFESMFYFHFAFLLLGLLCSI